MPKKNRKSVEPVPLAAAPARFHRGNWKDYVHEVDERRVVEKLSRFFLYIEPTSSESIELMHESFIREEAVRIANYKSQEVPLDDFKSGKLSLVGYRDTGDGHLWRIPKFVWTDPGALEDWRKGRVSGCGLVFLNVGVLEAADAANVLEFSKRRRSQKADRGPALDQCEKCLRKERERWKAAGSPMKGWKPKAVYKRQALDELNERGLSHRDFDAIFQTVFPKLIGNIGRSGWCNENDNNRWITDI